MRSVQSKAKNVVFARLFEGEELLETISSTALKNHINSGFFFLIGTLKKAVLGFYKEGKYIPKQIAGPLEIASCMGNISTKENNEIVVHGHIVVTDVDCTASGGHILKGCLVDATVELVLVEAESGSLRRRLNQERNLFLWFLE
ncbi:MAG: DNA-binding protein [Candidatus Bathyarchaeota archaeon]|nr:DNA-binding protein [Candidatus Bathyarchaeota archaeon]